ncbi:Peptidase M23 family protein [Exiguobacterium sp. 8H]|uniref:M23 family metallopeptidase n=1 Tax=unclassified Exiguobacterium TaxID=2644629 RepID=UPI0012F1BBC2|nr:MULTISPECIES: M23 family metallopeptidase [unclassified Exiguobacterium]VXB50856.1 Peptidase M23 family protein [Exiguobacterium sp. 8A]VXB51926.1 Peptidase M23 family protein [Exiguobacterium sp. 8H]
MAEKAILPLNRARLTAGYKNAAYRKRMGFTHYGVDMADLTRKDMSVYAPFAMKIVAVGNDDLMGRTIIGVSENPVEVHHGPKKGAHRLVVRMAHLDKVFVKKGDVVKPEGKKIANYGSTGKYGNSPHLHIEIDTDVKFPTHSPTLASSSNIWKAGADTTINPMDVFKVDQKGERGMKQSFSHANASGDWLKTDDKTTLNLQGKVIKSKGV